MASQGDHVDSARILLYHKAPVDDVTVVGIYFELALHILEFLIYNIITVLNSVMIYFWLYVVYLLFIYFLIIFILYLYCRFS